MALVLGAPGPRWALWELCPKVASSRTAATSAPARPMELQPPFALSPRPERSGVTGGSGGGGAPGATGQGEKQQQQVQMPRAIQAL